MLYAGSKQLKDTLLLRCDYSNWGPFVDFFTQFPWFEKDVLSIGESVGTENDCNAQVSSALSYVIWKPKSIVVGSW